MNTMIGSTFTASTKPTTADCMPPAPGVCTTATAGQFPNGVEPVPRK